MNIYAALFFMIAFFGVGYLIGTIKGYNKGYNDSPSHDEWFNEE